MVDSLQALEVAKLVNKMTTIIMENNDVSPDVAAGIAQSIVLTLIKL